MSNSSIVEYRLVIVEWEDITSNSDAWLYMEDALDLEPAKMTTIGWMVKDRKDSIVLVSSLGEEREVSDVNCIPKSVIKSMKEVNVNDNSGTI